MANANKGKKVRIEMDSELADMFGGFDKKTADKRAAGLKQTNYIKLGAGRHIIRILPGRKGALPFSEVYQHMIKPAGGKMFSINCPQKANGSHCPVCARVDMMRNSDIEADKALAKDMQAKLSISCNAIVRKADGEGEIGVLRLPRGVYEKVLALGSHEDVLTEYEDVFEDCEYVDLTHPTQGFDIRLEKSGSGLKTEYTVGVVARSHNTPALSDITRLKEVLKSMPDLEAMGKILSEAEINTALMGPAAEGTPAIAERSAERAMHDAAPMVDASAADPDEDDDDSEDGGKDKDIPF